MFENFGIKSSKVWRFWKEKFQALEVLQEKVPSIGSLQKEMDQSLPRFSGGLPPQRCLSRRMRE